jgi:hypothetical protein
VSTPEGEDHGLPRRQDLTIDPPPAETTTEETPAPPARAFLRAVTSAEIEFLARLEIHIQKRFPDGLPSWSAERTSEITERMLDGFPTQWIISAIGPAFDTAGLAKYWELSERTLRRRITAGTVFALKTERGRWLFPDLQLDSSGAVHPGVLDLLARATQVMSGDPWAAARWILTTAEPAPITHIRRGHLDRAHQLLEQISESEGER